jgi:hypothetical protein
MNPKHQEVRLIRRIAHLRTILSHTDDSRIVITLKEFIAETKNQIVGLKTNPRYKTPLH